PSDIGFYLGVPELGVIPAERGLTAAGMSRRSNGHGRIKMPDLGANTLNLAQVLPTRVELETWQSKQGLIAESFRAALTSILFTGQNGNRPKILVVTSPGVGEGKTTVTTNLAIAMAEIGQRVLLIDGDMRKPRIHALFGLDN